MKKYKVLVIILLLFTVYNSFFLNKAFHIDDPFIITVAKAINEHFIVKVSANPQILRGNPIFREIICDNPIILGYYYAFVIKLFGEKEMWLHLFLLPFSLLTIASMYLLSLRFTRKRFLPVLFLIITPAFLIMSHSIMLDVPLLGLFLTTLIVFIYGIDRDDNKLLFLSATLAGMTSLIKYSGLIVILLMFIYILLFTNKRRYYLFLLIPIGIFLLWCIHEMISYKRIYFLTTLAMRLNNFSINTILFRMFACLSFISGTSVVSLFLILFMLRNKTNIFLLLSSIPIGLCPFIIGNLFSQYSSIEKLILAILFISSLFLIFLMFKPILVFLFRNVPNSKDKLFLSLWFFIFLFFTVLIQFVAARFILLLFPPMFLLISDDLVSSRTFSADSLNKQITLSVFVTIFVSTILAIGDYYFAGVYRDFVTSLKEKIPVDKNVYICPSSFNTYLSWGYAYYLQKNYPELINIEVKTKLTNMKDFVLVLPKEPVLPMIIHKICYYGLGGSDYNRKLISRFYYKSNIILHNQKYRAGFYSHDWGLLPFYISFKKVPIETFDIYCLSDK
jgi:4-amino-4-deoxy-L-arabinose transferase-like glycosyltransferase